MSPGPAVGVLSGAALECRDPAALAAFHLSFQLAPGHVPPQWPDPASSMQAHLHLRVGDPDTSRVLADPAGHPFCLCR